MNDEKYMLIVRDYATGWLDCIPTKSKTGQASHDAFLEFLGDEHVSRIYSDNSLELRNMARLLGVA